MSRFTDGQINRLANIFDNAGQVVLGVVVVSPLVSSSNNRSFPIVLLGLIVVIFCWILSIWLSKKGN